MAMETTTCNLCGRRISGYGNNPYPLTTGGADRCCDACDNKYVLPVRVLTIGKSLSTETIADLVSNIRNEEGYSRRG